MARFASVVKGALTGIGLWGFVPRWAKSGYNSLTASPYADATAAGPGEKGFYTWLIHMYPPKHNAGAEWMAHAINTYLIETNRSHVAVVVNDTDVGTFERVQLLRRNDSAAVHRAVSNSSVLLSHLDMEASAVKTAAMCRKPLVLVVHNSFRPNYLKKFKKQLPGNLYVIYSSTWIQNVYRAIALPWGVIEAMASGIPVVAHPTIGLKESCSYAAIYCDRNEPEEWVREIRRLKTDRDYYERKSAECERRARELDPRSQLAAMADWLEGLQWKEPAAAKAARARRG